MGKVSFKYGTASQLANAPYLEGTFYVISDNNSTDGILYADLNNKRICFGDVASLVEDVSDLESSIPTKVSELTNDSGFISSYTETDPTVPSWAKQSTKPTYTATEVGALPDTTAIPSKTSDLTNDSGFVKRFVVTITENNPEEYYSADKTFSEIVAAYQNGYEIVCHCMMDNSFIPFLALSDNLIQFELSAMTSNGTPAAEYVSITSTNDITLRFMSFTETDPTVPTWAKQSSKPSYNFSEIGSKPTTISGYGISDTYTKTQIDGLVAGVLHYKGTKAAVSNLPTSGNTTGDTWHIIADGSEWAWDGTTWQELGTAVDLSNYVTTDDSRLSDARTPTAHNQALSTITGADDLKAIEGLTGTNGLLKKTAANTWTLDTNNYTSNTGTVTSIGLTNATNGGLTISGSPITNSGSITVGHSNVLSSAQTTQAVYPIKIDKNGHISAYGSAVSIPTKVSDLTNDSGYLTTATLPIYDESLEDI